MNLQCTNSKDYIWSSNCHINLPNQSPIPSWIIKWMTVIKPLVHIGFYWSASRLAPQKSCFLQKIQSILSWERSILCFWCAISIPRKYLNLPMSLVTKWRLRYSFVSNSPPRSLPVSKILSAHAIRTTIPDFVRRTKTEWSEWHRWKPMPEMVMLNFSDHGLGLCLRPYIAFFRRETSFSP